MWNNQYENVKYKRHALAMAIPLMAGYKWRDWTFMLGLNAAMPVWQTASFAGDHTTTIKDEQLYDDFQNMPNHGLTTTPFMTSRFHTAGIHVSETVKCRSYSNHIQILHILQSLLLRLQKALHFFWD
jgi:hypothetical protein